MTKVLGAAANVRRQLVEMTKTSADRRANRRPVVVPTAVMSDDFFAGC